MFCMNCGNKLEEDSRFCTVCGVNVKEKNDVKEERKPEEKNQDSELEANKEGKDMPWEFIALGVITIGIILLFINMHTCDWCRKLYVGAQYYDMWDTSELMCEDCALEYYMGPGYKNYKK